MTKRILIGSGFLAAMFWLLVGCTQGNGAFGKAYCDDTGCFRCDGQECTPIANPECSMDDQCGPGEECTTIGCAKVCSDTDSCSEDESCVDGFCAPLGFGKVVPLSAVVSCSADDQCPEDQYCGDSGKCLPRCKSDDECGPDHVCIPCGKCQPSTQPATCGSKMVYCSDEVSCGNGKQCQDSRCHFTCSGDDECPVGQICGSDGVCLDDPAPANPECAVDVDCQDGVCVNGYCHALCQTSGDCPGRGSICLMGACQPDYHP